MEISGSLSDTTRVLTNGWPRNGNTEPLESAQGEKEMVKHTQGQAGPDGPVSQVQEQTESKQMVKHAQGQAGPDGPVSQTREQTEPKQLKKRVQRSAEPRRTARTFRVYSRNSFLRAIEQRRAAFFRHV